MKQALTVRIIGGLALAALSAALLILAFPPHNLGLLIWVAFIPMLTARYRVLPPRLSSRSRSPAFMASIC